MPYVYVPQIPARFDGNSNLWIPTINIKPASAFGEVLIMLPPAANRTGIEACAAAISHQMADYGPDDYLVAVGDPTLYAVAACHAAKRAGGLLRMLKWDRLASGYILEEVNVT